MQHSKTNQTSSGCSKVQERPISINVHYYQKMTILRHNSLMATWNCGITGWTDLFHKPAMVLNPWNLEEYLSHFKKLTE